MNVSESPQPTLEPPVQRLAAALAFGATMTLTNPGSTAHLLPAVS